MERRTDTKQTRNEVAMKLEGGGNWKTVRRLVWHCVTGAEVRELAWGR